MCLNTMPTHRPAETWGSANLPSPYTVTYAYGWPLEDNAESNNICMKAEAFSSGFTRDYTISLPLPDAKFQDLNVNG